MDFPQRVLEIIWPRGGGLESGVGEGLEKGWGGVWLSFPQTPVCLLRTLEDSLAKRNEGKPHQQKLRGIFWGFCLCVFSPPEGMISRNAKTRFCYPLLPGTIPQIVYVYMFLLISRVSTMTSLRAEKLTFQIYTD